MAASYPNSMAMTVPYTWLRRLAAHLTTPLVVALPWALLLADRPSVGTLWGAVGLCYLGWLMLGIPVVLLRRSRPRPRLWRYAAEGAALGAFALLITGAGWRSGEPSFLIVVPVAAVAGAWYWLCAYWQPARRTAPKGGAG